MTDLARLTDLIEQEVTASGFALVRVKLFGSDDERTLQVMAENPETGQLVIDQCMAISRRISDAIDKSEAAGDELIQGAYRLEVSSPGIDRPLTRAGDFAKWVGHEARITLSKDAEAPAGNKRTFQGDLTAFDDGMVTVEDKKLGAVTMPVTAIHSAKLMLTDRLIKSTVPLDITGADEVEEVEDMSEEDAD